MLQLNNAGNFGAAEDHQPNILNPYRGILLCSFVERELFAAELLSKALITLIDCR